MPMEINKVFTFRDLATVNNWLRDFLGPWFGNQFSALVDQIIALTISATVGGYISWLITRRSDNKNREREHERETERRKERDWQHKQRNIFEYRHWKASKSDRERKKWDVNIDTSPRNRRDWLLSAMPKFEGKVPSVRFFLGSRTSASRFAELTKENISSTPGTPSLDAHWIENGDRNGHWKIEDASSCLFVFGIGETIDEMDNLTIFYKTEDGVACIETHAISPFDSMKDYRPWGVDKPPKNSEPPEV